VVLGLFAAASTANAANSVSITPSSQVILFDDLATLALAIAFDDSTLGGGIVITPVAGLDFESFSFDAGFPDTPALRLVCPNASVPACDDFAGPGILIAFGSATGLSGVETVGSLELRGSVPGIHGITLAEDAVAGIAGPFVPFGATFDTPTFGSASVEVGEPPISAPGLGGTASIGLISLLLVVGARRSARAATDV
jgi:hypothetical protein